MAQIKTVSVTQAKSPVWDALHKKALEEDKSDSEMVIIALEEYLRAHAGGNPAYTLDKFSVEGFKAYPTAWKLLGRKDLDGCSKEEIAQMQHILETNLQTLRNIDRHPVATKDTGKRR